MGMVGLTLLAGSVLAVGLTWAADPKDAKADDKAVQRDNDVANIHLAMQLSEVGHKAESPEALIGAARILAKIKDLTEVTGVKGVEEKDVDTKKAPKTGTAIKRVGEEGVKGIDFSEQIKKLVTDAKDMAKDDKGLTAYIDSLKLDATRGGVGGPRTFNDGVDVGKSRSYTIKFRGGEQARVVCTSDNNVLVQVHRSSDQFLEGSFQGKNVELFWNPAKENDFTVRVTNTTGKPAKFSLFVN
jgi:hypothetical protein